MLEIIIQHDTSGHVSYPLILQELLDDPGGTPHLYFDDDPFASTKHIDAWVENFAQLADSQDPIVRDWVIENLPVELGSEHDELLDSIALRFLNSGDEDLMYYAEEKLRTRMADHLIAPEDGDEDDDDWDDDW